MNEQADQNTGRSSINQKSQPTAKRFWTYAEPIRKPSGFLAPRFGIAATHQFPAGQITGNGIFRQEPGKLF